VNQKIRPPSMGPEPSRCAVHDMWKTELLALMPGEELNALFRFDRRWPTWVAGTYSVVKQFDRTAAETLSSNRVPHPLLSAAKEPVELKPSDNPVALVMFAQGESIGEFWLRVAVLHRSEVSRKRSWLRRYCETYVYRRGWRDTLTAEMDGQRPGEVIYIKRADDVYCNLDRINMSISIEASPYRLRLSKTR